MWAIECLQHPEEKQGTAVQILSRLQQDTARRPAALLGQGPLLEMSIPGGTGTSAHWEPLPSS